MKPLRWDLRQWMREPLLHFLLAGAAIYALFAWIGNDGPADHRQLNVNRATLLQYMQYRAKAFEPAAFAAQFDALSAEGKQSLIDDYVREEALYREAKSIGLEQGDYVMRQRLVQKMGFLMESSIAIEPSEAELQQYLDAHRDQYAIAASMTFTHVFVDNSLHGSSEKSADAMLKVLNTRKAGFNDAPQFGDRFPYLQNYVERTAEYIGSQFGEEFVTALQALPAKDAWQGPLRSQLGWHLVMITVKTDARVPQLSELHAQVADDFKRDRTTELQQQAVKQLIERYQVRVDLTSP